MKTKRFILSAALIISATGCSQNTDLAAPPSAEKQDGLQKQTKPAEPVTQNQQNAGKRPSQHIENIKIKSTPVAQNPTEQSLAEVAARGREITRSQESKPRSRAQLAEDEMQKDLQNFR